MCVAILIPACNDLVHIIITDIYIPQFQCKIHATPIQENSKIQ